MRARVQVARDWENAHSRSCLYGGPGMGAQRASWQAAFAAEDAARSGDHFAQSFLDLVKAFEMIPHHHIAAAAQKHGYSPWLLRLSLAAYRLQRVIGVEGLYSRPIVASRGITAGSGFATPELRVLLLDVIDNACSLYPWIGLAVYVDDMTVYKRGTSHHSVATQVVLMTDDLITSLQDEYQLEVSAQKSYVVASSFKLACKVASYSRTAKLTGKRAGKLLGAPAGGGRRRSVQSLVKRLKELRRKVPRIHALRRARIPTQHIVRTAGTPAVTYAIEVTGASNTHLQNLRSCIARAASPEAGGKNPDLTLFFLDADDGTLDPAFDAHVLPLKFWSMAIWEGWVAVDSMVNTVSNVHRKLLVAKSPWGVTTGPVATLLNSLSRIGWQLLSYASLIDDRGHSFDLRVDPPAVICRAAVASVRRWRLARIAHSFHGMEEFYNRMEPLPGQPTHLLDRHVVDISRCIRLSKQGRTGACKSCPHWSHHHASMLASAVSGGQWPQSRLASVERFNILDNRCQLCLAEVGTLEHRYNCPANRPHSGWIRSDPDAEQFIAALPDSQRLCLVTRGILFCKIPVPPRDNEASFRWHLPLPPDVLDGLTFYIDGSAMDADCYALVRFGFAIVAVSDQGELVALGHGSPPSWIVDSGGAEAWALYMVLSMCPDVPNVVTDYLGIVNTLRDGKDRATSSTRIHARLWQMIHAALDSEEAILTAQRHVVWMPSHGSRNTIGVKSKSDGSIVSAIDWRANRLADAAAKAAALAVRASAADRIRYHRTVAAYEHALAELATVTVAANHHKVQLTDSDGTCRNVIMRDSAALPRAKRPRLVQHASSLDAQAGRNPLTGQQMDAQPPPQTLSAVSAPSAFAPEFSRRRRASPSLLTPSSARQRMARDYAAITAAHQTNAWRDARDARSFTAISAAKGSASDRLAAIQNRVKLRTAG